MGRTNQRALRATRLVVIPARLGAFLHEVLQQFYLAVAVIQGVVIVTSFLHGLRLFVVTDKVLHGA